MNASQPRPSDQPLPAWTKTVGGEAYTVKRIGGAAFGIWRDVESLGTFELRGSGPSELRAVYAGDLSLEARAVVDEFIATYSEPFEGAARRDS
jgi:hypothetical protein